MAAAWIGVGVTYFSVRTARRSASISPSSAKEVKFEFLSSMARHRSFDRRWSVQAIPRAAEAASQVICLGMQRPRGIRGPLCALTRIGALAALPARCCFASTESRTSSDDRRRGARARSAIPFGFGPTMRIWQLPFFEPGVSPVAGTAVRRTWWGAG
jgi:hypothetical protein